MSTETQPTRAAHREALAEHRPQAITVDVDDTLLMHGTRPNKGVVDFVNRYAAHGHVIILTARHERRRAETRRQLDGLIKYNELRMRGSNLPEVPYKREAMQHLTQRWHIVLAVENHKYVRSAYERLGVHAVAPQGSQKLLAWAAHPRAQSGQSDYAESENSAIITTSTNETPMPDTSPQPTAADQVEAVTMNFHMQPADAGLGGVMPAEINDEMPEDVGEPLAEQLGDLLANVVTFYFRAHGSHWNCKGEDFAQYHELFESIYEDAYGSIDPIAENILKLGYDSPFRLTEFIALREIDDATHGSDEPLALAADLLEANTLLIADLLEAFQAATEENQQGIANFLAERVDMHQKWGWQLRASLGAQGEEEPADPEAMPMGQMAMEADGGSLTMAMRKRHATVVRTMPDGTKEYKFPIPDKAHARAALAYVNKSDLTPTERAKVIRKAYSKLGTTPAPEMADAMKESVDLTLVAEGQRSEEFGEAGAIGRDSKLSSNEMIVTIIKPGMNRSGSRYYPPSTIAEAIGNGMFNGRKMFVNHASVSEMRDRPERSLTDWVSTIKETWIEPETGAAKARIKIVQNWFGDFLKQLNENDSLPDVGLSIFAQGEVQRKKIEGRLTDVVERFTRALSVDWVTEPGAGGRVDAIWESYQPARAKEQEINVLNTMTAAEAASTLREQRPDVVDVLEAHAPEDLTAKIAELEAALAERDAKIAEHETAMVESAAVAAKAEQDLLVAEAVAATELPQASKERIIGAISETIVSDEGTFDAEKATERINELIEAEKAYAEEIIRESGRPVGGRGIAGLGDRQETTPVTAIHKVEADIARRMGLSVEESA